MTEPLKSRLAVQFDKCGREMPAAVAAIAAAAAAAAAAAEVTK
jgi:hypothetical protein